MYTMVKADRHETVCKHDFQGLVVGTTHYHAAGCDEMHSHEDPTICFFLRGGALEKRGGTSYERSASDARFYYAAEPHQSSVKTFPSQCLNLEFRPEFLERYQIIENTISSAIGESPEMKFAMLKIHREMLAEDALAQISIEMLILGVLDTKNKAARRKPVWIHTLRDLLHDRYMETLSLDELSAALGAHPVTISKYFRRYFGCTLGEYMRGLKIEKSLALVKNTHLPLTEIALRCGFTDQSHFTRNFKQITGFLPKDFKKL